MAASRRVVWFINIAHALDHLVMLIYPTAVLGMGASFGGSYGSLLALSLGGFIAFGAGSLPAGWLGDLWSRRNMMAVFFFGAGAATALTAISTTPFMLAAALTLVGAFAAIYHPVGTAMLVSHADDRLGRTIGVNGVWGNLGVAFAALLTGGITEWLGWRWAFVVPGAIAVALGFAFLAMVPDERGTKKAMKRAAAPLPRGVVIHAFSVLALVTIAGSVVFNATTVSMPKVFDERLRDLTQTNLGLGALVAFVYSVAAFAQVVVGTLIDRFEMRRLMITMALCQIPLLVLAANSQGWVMLGAAILMMLAVFGQIPLNDAIVGRYCADEYRSRVYAVRYVVTFCVAAVAVPLISLLHGTAGGFRSVFLVLACLATAILAAALFFPSRRALGSQAVPA